ncbi:hypothetical protein TREES_T100011690 [Tupaia chinensis]|uniref:Uncharacterized protein n=1 Tax=Tupaia chinensis TaxID=246437 RepID=L9L1X5_TUPCH|nr:hypothetical protein TREES_T100011690 [Tupaia chinensis]
MSAYRYLLINALMYTSTYWPKLYRTMWGFRNIRMVLTLANKFSECPIRNGMESPSCLIFRGLRTARIASPVNSQKSDARLVPTVLLRPQKFYFCPWLESLRNTETSE